jgi:hypothetical protein
MNSLNEDNISSTSSKIYDEIFKSMEQTGYPPRLSVLENSLTELELNGLAKFLKRKFSNSPYQIEELIVLIKDTYKII